ncbi:MAG: DUF362 domain-containing protein [Candidatus Thorarchaeota archaeon]
MDSVSLVKAEGSITKSLEEGLNLIGGFGNLKSPVIVKPNICTISDDTGYSVTDVRVVESIIDIVLREDNALSIKIVESDSESKYAMPAFEKFGYKQLAEDKQREGFDVSLVDLSQPPLVSVKLDGNYFDDLEIHESITKYGYFISVAIAKTHQSAFLTGSLKNQFGLLPRKNQNFYHSDIDDVIVDLNRFVQPNLSIVDARVGVEGWNGPNTRKLDAFILGHQPVSVDATMARIMGFEPERISHLVKSSKFNLGSLDPPIKGQTIDSMRVMFKAPSIS